MNFPIALMCRVLKQSRSRYYAWCNRLVAARTQENALLSAPIQRIYDTSRQSYGSPRIQAALAAQG
ncbi:IS3 family transposase, partial [Halomicronema sp. CCY15110]|uniref:IS3 family transposase n=1 Tax=Halomicronema sp. CCY15110 TaxID=2767773 RepID=UPI001951A301